MKKYLLLAILFLFSLISLLSPSSSFAQSVRVGPCGANIGNKFDSLCSSAYSPTVVGKILSNSITALMVVAALLSLVFLIWGGFKWITSGGDKAKVEAARNTIIAAIVGLLLTLLAYFILSLVLGLFGISLSDLKLIKLN